MYQLVLLKNGVVVQTWKMKNEQEIKKRLNSYIDKVYIDLMRDGTYKLNNTYTYDVWKISSDNVNNPSHYTQGKVECIDALESATVGKKGIEAVCVANVVKYLWRYEEKNGLEDVKKAEYYLKKLIDIMEKSN